MEVSTRRAEVIVAGSPEARKSGDGNSLPRPNPEPGEGHGDDPHSRTGFVDGPEPQQKRHMLRLWLKFPKPWPLGPDFPSHMGYKPAQDTTVLVEAEASPAVPKSGPRRRCA